MADEAAESALAAERLAMRHRRLSSAFVFVSPPIQPSLELTSLPKPEASWLAYVRHHELLPDPPLITPKTQGLSPAYGVGLGGARLTAPAGTEDKTAVKALPVLSCVLLCCSLLLFHDVRVC